MSGKMILDNDPYSSNVVCGSKFNEFSKTPFLVEKEIKLHFDTSDMTWLIFVSEPTSFVCTNSILDTAKINDLPPGVVRFVTSYYFIVTMSYYIFTLDPSGH
jgi:hypothetical protein